MRPARAPIRLLAAVRRRALELRVADFRRLTRDPLLSDLRRFARDPILVALAVVPPALALALRFAMPRLAPLLPAPPGVVATTAAAALLLITPMLFGFVAALLLLDERDEGVLAAVAVTPVGKRGFLAYRMVAPAAWTAGASVVVLRVAGLADVGETRLVALALLAGMEAPLLALFVGAFAPSKIEGMALAKVGSVLIGVGALAVLAPWPLQALASPSPHYWLVRVLVGSGAALTVVAAFVVHAAALAILAWRFGRRVG